MWRRSSAVINGLLCFLSLACIFLLYHRNASESPGPFQGHTDVGELELANYRLKALQLRNQELKETLSEIKSLVRDQAILNRDSKLQVHEVLPASNDVAGRDDSKVTVTATTRSVPGAAGDAGPAERKAPPAAAFHDMAASRDKPVLDSKMSSKVVDQLVGLDHVPSNAALAPKKKQSKDRAGVTLVIGIPTIHRSKMSYLDDTIRSLIGSLAIFDKSEILFIVMVGDTEPDKVDKVFNELLDKYPEEIKSGMIDIISPPDALYPDFKALTPSFSDSQDRYIWRTKQVFDFAYLMMYARTRGFYYLQVEDDIKAREDYASHIVERAKRDSRWDVLEFSSLGFIGKLFRCSQLTDFAHFFLANAFYKPVDWLLDDWFSVRYCHPEKDFRDCRKRKAEHRVLFKPALFQHIGHYSSLDGKIQKLQDSSFKTKNLPALHSNPVATVSSSIKPFQGNTIEAAYVQSGVFWGMSQSAGDRITIAFASPTQIKRVLISSGNTDHPGDTFRPSVKLEYIRQDDYAANPTDPKWVFLASPNAEHTIDWSAPKQENSPLVHSLSVLFPEDSKTWIIIPGIHIHT